MSSEPIDPREVMNHCMSTLIYSLNSKTYPSDEERRLRDPELTTEIIRYIIQFLPTSAFFPYFRRGEKKTHDDFLEHWNRLKVLHRQEVLYASSRTRNQEKEIEDILIKLDKAELRGYEQETYNLSSAEEKKLKDAKKWLFDRRLS